MLCTIAFFCCGISARFNKQVVVLHNNISSFSRNFRPFKTADWSDDVYLRHPANTADVPKPAAVNSRSAVEARMKRKKVNCQQMLDEWETKAETPGGWNRRSFRPKSVHIGRVSYLRIYLCYFCFRWKTVSLVQASLQYLMHYVTVSLQ